VWENTPQMGQIQITKKSAPEFYSPAKDSIEAEIEFARQIVRLTILNTSVYTNVSVTKRGYTHSLEIQNKQRAAFRRNG
jgi:hypothetical protein